jgi:hypothetical protein
MGRHSFRRNLGLADVVNHWSRWLSSLIAVARGRRGDITLLNFSVQVRLCLTE